MSEGVPAGKPTEQSDLVSVRIGIGDVVQLQDFSSVKQRHYVKLIGYLNKKSVLVSHPMLDEKLIFVKKGESYLVRGFSGTKTYDFTTDVINVCLAPYPYLHLSFPSQINTVNMRNSLRVKIGLVCSIKLKATELVMPSTIVDMSISGARIQSITEFGNIGEVVEMRFRLPIDGMDQLLVVPAVVRNVGRDPDGIGKDYFFQIGLEFLQSEGNERIWLQNFIYKNLVDI